MDFRLRLVVEGVEQLPLVGRDGCNLITGIEWRGSEKKAAGFLARRFEKNYTCRQKLQENGAVSWNEGFYHTCRYKMERSELFRSWIVVLRIEEVHGTGRDRMKKKKRKIGKVRFDVAEFVQCEMERSIRIPIRCSLKGNTAEALLKIKLQLIKLDSENRNPVTLKRHNSSMKQRQRSFAKLFSCTYVGEEDGEVCNGRSSRQKSCIQFARFKQVKVRPEENFGQSASEEKPKFEAGCWERRKIVSRDGKMELAADVFLASIDQCSKRAAGGSACTVLAAVVADWLHSNPKSLPMQRQFDELVLKGSLEWRNLCADGNNRAKFSDRHFDLDTVLEEKVRSLEVISEKSSVGFFGIDGMPEGFECPQGDMSFDAIWKGILCGDASEAKIYIAGWNDHFFVLKVEEDVIYLLDTLGERLSEGCNQAYILKFDAESAINRHGSKEEEEEEDVVVARGIGCCKEYIKGFLSAVPLSGLRQDIKRGKAGLDLLHRLLQIDFHFTAPCGKKMAC